jgi:hypothetical protein
VSNSFGLAMPVYGNSGTISQYSCVLPVFRGLPAACLHAEPVAVAAIWPARPA